MIHTCNVLIFLSRLFVYCITGREQPTEPPDSRCHPTGYHRKRRRLKQYYLRGKIRERIVAKPIRDLIRPWDEPWTWNFLRARRIPVEFDADGNVKLKTSPRVMCRKLPKVRYKFKMSGKEHRKRRREWKADNCWAEPEPGDMDETWQEMWWMITTQSHLYPDEYEKYFGSKIEEIVADSDPVEQFRMMKQVVNGDILAPVTSQAPLPCVAVQGHLAKSLEQLDRERRQYSSLATENSLRGFVAMFQAESSVPVPTKTDPISEREQYDSPFSFQALQEISLVPIVIDSGASTSITPFREDFVGKITPYHSREISGLNGKSLVLGIGTVEWKVSDYYGTVRIIRTKALYVPDSTIRLLSPQSYFKEVGGGSCLLTQTKTLLTLKDGSQLEFPYNCGSNLPFMFQPRDERVNIADYTVRDYFDFSTNPPTQSVFSDHQAMFCDEGKSIFLTNLHPNNQNLNSGQKELPLLHQKLGHLNFQRIQNLTRKPRDDREQVFVPRHGANTCAAPLCAPCLYAKQRRRTPETNRHGGPPEMAIRAGNLRPGSCFSLDQFISSEKGRLPHTRGKESESNKCVGGTIGVDHASGYVVICCQSTLTAGNTILSKRKMDAVAEQYGFRIKEFRADNVPFGSAEFRRECEESRQELTFSGVGAHHQNGVAERAIQTVVAERAIQTVTQMARAMLLHAMLMWPDAAATELWPFALNHAAHVWNHVPKDQGDRLSPIEIFSGQKFPNYNHVRSLRVWGCPAYVLDPKLQDGKKIPKWAKRSRRGQFLGRSTEHADNIRLILNRSTGNVSPQYHVVYDDLFSTVPDAETGHFSEHADGLPINAVTWRRIFQTGMERTAALDEAEGRLIPSLHDDWLTPAEQFQRLQNRRNRRERRQYRRQQNANANEPAQGVQPAVEPNAPAQAPRRHAPEGDPLPAIPVPEGAGALQDQVQDGIDFQLDEVIDDAQGVVDERDEQDDELSLVDEGDMTEAQLEQVSPVETVREEVEEENREYRTRSGRRVKPRAIFDPSGLQANLSFNPYPNYEWSSPNAKVKNALLNRQYLMSLSFDDVISQLQDGTLSQVLQASSFDHAEETLEYMHPMHLASKANSEDFPSWEQAMNGPDRDGYWEAAKTEIATLEKMEAWDVVERKDWMSVLPSTWAFRCKRYPNGLIRKLKARFCCRGDRQQHGVDYFETFAPVVRWETVRLMLALSIILKLATTQVDYTAAFVHAPIDRDPNWDNMTDEERERSGVFLEMPRVFGTPGCVLKLKKSLYGLKQSPRNFFNHLKSKLKDAGLEQAEDVDPCLFLSEKVIALNNVDDTLFFAKDQKDIDDVIEKLRKSDLDLDVERGDVAGFLGVHIERDEPNNTITMTQVGLTKNIIEALNLDPKRKYNTPASKDPLSKDLDGDPGDATYSYASVVGMMQYLQGHTRHDIAYAVTQCARFVHNPKRSHYEALERIGYYLKGTLEKGLIYRPRNTFDVDCYVDADFFGLWSYEDVADPTSVKSRTGYVIAIAGCPVMWGSKLQPEIALSTMQAEYIALSMCMKELIPFLETAKCVFRQIGNTVGVRATFKTIVWEDNVGALTLANKETGQVTPRSKFYGVKVLWFRSKLKPNEIEVVKIGTEEQQADILTKGLQSNKFVEVRKLLCEW